MENISTMPKMTVGMATYDTPEETILTIQALRYYHGQFSDFGQIVVVDNKPSSYLERFCKKENADYIPFPSPTGTWPTRNEIFKHATGDVVVVIDPHVMFPQTILLRIATYAQANPTSLDLWHGPLLDDKRRTIHATHLEPRWGSDLMYGVWGRDTRADGFNGEPFEIPMSGAGMFACRKDAWLPFPEAEGFGADEWIMHEKFRQAGRRVLCLPFAPWWHLFRDMAKPPPFPVTIEIRLKKYLIGFRHLGLDETELLDMHRKRLGNACVDSVLASMESVPRFDPQTVAKSPPPVPSIWRRTWNFGRAMARAAIEGFPTVSETEFAARLDVCEANTCGMRNGDICTHKACGCFIEKKASLATEDCPLGLWPKKATSAIKGFLPPTDRKIPTEPQVEKCPHLNATSKTEINTTKNRVGHILKRTVVTHVHCDDCGIDFTPAIADVQELPAKV